MYTGILFYVKYLRFCFKILPGKNNYLFLKTA